MARSDSGQGSAGGRKSPPASLQYVASTSVGLHWYKALWVPSACEDFEVDERYELYVTEPPPESLILNNQGASCRGSIFKLDE